MKSRTGTKALKERVLKTISEAAINAFPEEHTIPSLRINDFRRLSLLLNTEQKQKLHKKLSPLQRRSLPPGWLV